MKKKSSTGREGKALLPNGTEKRLFVLAVACSAISNAAGAGSLFILQPFVDNVLTMHNWSHAVPLVLQFLGLTITSSIFYFFESILTARAGNRLAFRIRNLVYGHLQNLSLGFFSGTRMGDILSRLTSDLELLQSFYTTNYKSQVTLPIEVSIGIGAMVHFSLKLTLFSIIVIPLVGVLILVAQQRMKHASLKARMKVADIMSFLQESILNMKVIQLFTLEQNKSEQFEGHNRESYRAAMREALIRSMTTALVMLVGSMTIAMVMLVAVNQAQTDALTTGALVGFLFALANKTITPLRRVNDVYLSAKQAGVARSRIGTLLAEDAGVRDRPGAKAVPEVVRGDIEFEDVVMTYDGETDVLRGLNLRIPAGTTLALVGPSGAGKTTIINLIPRFYDPREGSVTLDGTDLREFTRDSLRRVVGVVPQETILFNTTIGENIRLGKPDATEEEVVAAAKAANAHEFIASFPEGYDTVVGERGSKLSGGQQQRVAIARALLKNPRILIMDEAVSGLDADSEVKIQDAIDRAFRDRTAVLIAHRLSTAKRADVIAVIEKGRVAELGTHDELMAADGPYRKLYDLQFKLKREISVG